MSGGEGRLRFFHCECYRVARADLKGGIERLIGFEFILRNYCGDILDASLIGGRDASDVIFQNVEIAKVDELEKRLFWKLTNLVSKTCFLF